MTISERLAKLERDNRRCRRLLVGLVLLFGVTLYWTMGHQSQTADAAVQAVKRLSCDELTVRNIKLVNGNGDDVGQLGMSVSGGWPSLFLDDRKGKTILVGPAEAWPSIFLMDRVQDTASRITSIGISTGIVNVRAGSPVTNYQPRAILATTVPPSRGGAIALLNPFNKEVVRLQSGKNNGGSIVTYDSSDKPTGALP